MVPALVAIRFNRHRATASSLAAILLIALAGAIAFGIAGDVDLPTGVFLGLGGLLGSTVGAHWMNRLSVRSLARIFGVVLLVAGIRMAIGGGVAEGGFEPAPIISFALELLIGGVAGTLSGIHEPLARAVVEQGIERGFDLLYTQGAPGLCVLRALPLHHAEPGGADRAPSRQRLPAAQADSRRCYEWGRHSARSCAPVPSASC